jgi:ceramide glucosyltransferase
MRWRDRVTAAALSGFPWVGFALAAFAMVHSIVACAVMRMRIRSSRFTANDPLPVTILKPLCGAEPETYECLRSFCDQTYPEFQVVFGVCDSSDPAIADSTAATVK